MTYVLCFVPAGSNLIEIHDVLTILRCHVCLYGEVIYQTREGVFHRISKHREASFLTDFEVVGYLMKHSFECLILLLKEISILLKRHLGSKLAKCYAN